MSSKSGALASLRSPEIRSDWYPNWYPGAIWYPGRLLTAGERGRHELRVTRPRRVVGVALRRLNVAVAHPFLQGAHRHARRRHRRAERVAQIMKAMMLVQAGSLQRFAHPVQHGGLLERAALGRGSRVGEDQLALGGSAARLVVAVQRAADLGSHRHAAEGPPGLRRPELAHHIVLPHTDRARRPVDVAPAQRAQLAQP